MERRYAKVGRMVRTGLSALLEGWGYLRKNQYFRGFEVFFSIVLYGILGLTTYEFLKPPVPWPEAVIPYQISSDFSPLEKTIVLRAMAQWEEVTPVRFVEKSKETEYLSIIKGSKVCQTYGVGFHAGIGNTIEVDPNFCDLDAEIHELGHALGLEHEHQRPDRNNYVTIHWNCIKVSELPQYMMLPWSSFIDSPYDLNSVMHYPVENSLFSKCPRVTLNSGVIIPAYEWVMPSKGDAYKISKFYKEEALKRDTKTSK